MNRNWIDIELRLELNRYYAECSMRVKVSACVGIFTRWAGVGWKCQHLSTISPVHAIQRIFRPEPGESFIARRFFHHLMVDLGENVNICRILYPVITFVAFFARSAPIFHRNSRSGENFNVCGLFLPNNRWKWMPMTTCPPTEPFSSIPSQVSRVTTSDTSPPLNCGRPGDPQETERF